MQIKPAQTVSRRWRADAIIEYAEPNCLLRPMRRPNQPSFKLLWSLQNTGQTLGSYIGAGADFSQAVRESNEVNNALAGNATDLKSR